ncbi:Pseudouridine-5'-phosphate glycosidase [Nymphon striatum]|nr:Pseudouridine-5'-phosphate glycosidase [Nymphon striatum]
MLRYASYICPDFQSLWSVFNDSKLAVAIAHKQGFYGHIPAKKFYRLPLSFKIADEVQKGIARSKAIVALESTIITHGMPYPDNVRTALEVEEIIRQNGAIPATIGIINGKIKIGLSKHEIELLASGDLTTVKVSTPDLPYVMSQKISGGTTVAATMQLAHQANISVFVTGGIGGVHRGADKSFDISHDLKALGVIPLSVICAGVKSILDIGKTLEYLETQGVTTVTYGESTEFPSFFTPKSGFHSPYNVKNPSEAAMLIHSRDNLKLPNSVLFAVPIPCENNEDGLTIENAINQAVKEAEVKGISGKEVTPFILSQVNKLSKGTSLKLNQELIKNNAKVGAKIAVELIQIRKEKHVQKHRIERHENVRTEDHTISNKRLVIIGGTNVDYVMNVHEDASFCGRTLKGKIKKMYGGVGRNLAECISKLNPDNIPLFISAVGNDDVGLQIKKDNAVIDNSGIAVISGANTASYCAVIDNKGELLFGIGDMDVHQSIAQNLSLNLDHAIKDAPLVVLDGNLPELTLNSLIKNCNELDIPVWFEPTDPKKAAMPFTSDAWKGISFISPNFEELSSMFSCLSKETLDSQSTIQSAIKMSRTIIRHIPFLLITLGSDGVLLCMNSSFFSNSESVFKMKPSDNNSGIIIKHFPAIKFPKDYYKSVSGAGDCIAGTVISGLVKGFDIDIAVNAGIVAASKSVGSVYPVPDNVNDLVFSEARNVLLLPEPETEESKDSTIITDPKNDDNKFPI